ncbi:hypothetical protein ACJZ2D_011639 [Fusarium nematophilum]
MAQVVRIRNPLGSMDGDQLSQYAQNFHRSTSQTLTGLRPYPSEQEIQAAAEVSQDRNLYISAARTDNPNTPVTLNAAERRALAREVDHTFSEKGMWMVIVTVSLSAFLQGFVQSSQNGANLFADQWIDQSGDTDPRYAFANAAVYFSAAALGCPLAAALNSLFGRRGTILIGSVLTLAGSLGSAAIPLHDEKRSGIEATGENNGWALLSGIRVIGGIGMGLKAVTAPILAAETAVEYWRGSFVLTWQLWVSFGIMTSFIVNLGLNEITDTELKLRLIMASPAVFAFILMLVVFKCPESFRYYMKPGSRHYNPEKAFGSLLRLRNTKIQATRDLFLTHVGVEQEIRIEREAGESSADPGAETALPPVPGESRDGRSRRIVVHARNISKAIWRHVLQYFKILSKRRLRNAAIASGIVALAQQLSGSRFPNILPYDLVDNKKANMPVVNIMAFYGGSILVGGEPGQVLSDKDVNKAMVYNVIFGMLNFLFCLPGIHYIDSLGRRTILLFTIPWMAVALMAAAVSFDQVKPEIVAFWLYFHTIWYSPGMGPVPFILAAESFPLAFRETGASVAIGINFLFAGFLAFLQPLLVTAIGYSGTLGLFAGFNVISFVLIFLFVEETGGIRLEDLGLVFREPKTEFVRFQVSNFLPWLGKYLMGKSRLEDRPRRIVNSEEGEVEIMQ